MAYEKEESAIDEVAVSVEEMVSVLGECLTTTPTRLSPPKTTRS